MLDFIDNRVTGVFVALSLLLTVFAGGVATLINPANAVDIHNKLVKASVSGDGTDSVTLNVSDEPKPDDEEPVYVKSFGDAPEAGLPIGDIMMEGIKFRLSWYKGYLTKESEFKSTKPAMSAVWVTNKDGWFNIAKDKPVEGTWNSHINEGSNDLPLGTYRLEEVQANPGMNVSKKFTITHIKPDGKGGVREEELRQASKKEIDEGVLNNIKQGDSKARVHAFDNDEVWKGGLYMTKFNTNLDRSANSGDGELAGTEFTIYNRSKASVWMDGAEKKPGDAVMTITVQKGENGFFATTGEKVLPYGTYEVK